MAHRVKVNLPNLPKGEPVEVLHLGVFPNGETTTITGVKYEHYVDENGDDVPSDTKGAELVEADGPEVEVVIAQWEVQTGQSWPEGGTLVVDNSEAEADRKAAMADLKEEDPQAAKALVAEAKKQAATTDLTKEGK